MPAWAVGILTARPRPTLWGPVFIFKIDLCVWNFRVTKRERVRHKEVLC